MAAYWQVGNNYLDQSQVPFAPGTDEYYRYIATWRARAMGISYQRPDSAGTDGYDGEAYQKGLKDWWEKQYAQARSDDRRNQDALGYGHDDGGYYRDLNGNGVRDAAEQYGKYEGVGGGYGATAPDNRWNANWGKDVRTEQQKYYDRDIKNWEQVADADGHYSWWGDWSYRDNQGQEQKKRINLSAIGERDQAGKSFDTSDYGNYNGADRATMDEQVRTRKNLSRYARTF